MQKSHYNLGYLYQKQKLFESAAQQYEKAVKLKPKFIQALANWGLVWDRLHDPGKAVEIYQRALNVKQDEAPIYVRLGSSLMKMSQYGKAKAAFENALALGEVRRSVFHDMGVIYEQEGAPEKALTFYRRALGLRKGSSETHFRVAGVLKELDKPVEAMNSFQTGDLIRS